MRSFSDSYIGWAIAVAIIVGVLNFDKVVDRWELYQLNLLKAQRAAVECTVTK